MTGTIFLFLGSVLITIWGVAHIIPTRSVVRGFGEISRDNARIVRMTWVSEGLSLCFIGVVVLGVTILGLHINPVAVFVERAAAVMLLVSATWTAFTGARTPNVPMKLCPVVKAGVAVLFVIGSL